jgi:hypothetical protein
MDCVNFTMRWEEETWKINGDEGPATKLNKCRHSWLTKAHLSALKWSKRLTVKTYLKNNGQNIFKKITVKKYLKNNRQKIFEKCR